MTPEVAVAKKVETEEVEILSGNEAIARGAWEAGVRLAAAYPGTPSTEILEVLSKLRRRLHRMVAQREGGHGGGHRSLDGRRPGPRVHEARGRERRRRPVLLRPPTSAWKGGLVLVSADDPGMHSSQNEQDNRNYAKFAQRPAAGALRQRRGQGLPCRGVRR